MGLNAKDIPIAGGDYERPDPLEPGTYPARTVLIATLGTQAQRPFKGEEKPPKLELLVTYELLDEFLKDEDGEDIPDKPRWITETFTFNNLSSDLAKSTKRYYALDPKEVHKGDWSQLINVPCMVTVTVDEGKGKNEGRFYENVSNVSAMRPKEADKAPDLVNNPVVFDFYDPDPEAFAALPAWIRKKIAEALDYEGSAVSKLSSDAPKEAPAKDKPKPKAKVVAPPNDDLDDEIPW